MLEEILHYEGNETVEQVAQRSRGSSITSSVQSHVECASEQPDTVEGAPAHGRGSELNDF